MGMMRVATILLAIAMIATARGDAACDKAEKELVACTTKAYQNYQTEFAKGNDGRPDWMARKSCNYLTEVYETCGNMLVGVCKSQEEVDKDKDGQLKEASEQVSARVPNWDSEKCPPMKAHLDRLNPDTEGTDQGETDKVETDKHTKESDPTASATSVTASILSILV